ncbi:MAG: UDP-N-acetylmuramate dehydrogenase [Moraxella sp.]|nr:UDP-N-acetylmuramate dehydrogenase [Moraxella sp.]
MTDILSNHDLSHNNTMALSCTARHAMILDNTDTLSNDIATAIDFAKERDLSLFVLSYGSNVILPNQLNALVLLPRIKGIDVLQETDESITLQVACGENWHEFIQNCLDKGYFGLENLALIPGLVGACPVQNIGAYGVQVSDFITKVIAYDLMDGQRHEFNNSACDFNYRHSFFKDNPNRYLISHVVFRLHKDTKTLTNYGDLSSQAQKFATQNGRNTPHPIDVFHAVIDIRERKLPDPTVLANCGSFFQNPIIPMSQFINLKKQFADLPSYPIDDKMVKIPAGWLIDKAGLKGKGIAPILTHDKQALVLTNHAPHTATQDDIRTTQNFIVNVVQDKFGVTLVREPVWVD